MTRPGSSEGKESPNGISMDDYNHPSPIQNSIHEPLLHDSSGHPHHASRAESFARFHTLSSPTTPAKYLLNKPAKSRWFILVLVFLIISLICGIIVAILRSYQLQRSPTGLYLAEDRVLEASKFPERLRTSKTICSYCDCKANRTSPPLLQDSSYTTPTGTRASMLAHVWLSIRDIYCQHAWLGEGPALDLLLQTELGADIPLLIQWSLELLKPGRPTAYLYTKTSWAGRTKHLRYAYFKRHIQTIRTHLELMKTRAWPEGPGHQRWGQERQLIWIVIEDGEKLANDVAQELAASGLPYIYFTYGPTHHFGNAQQNAAYALIHRLADPTQDGIFGHGPIISIDDDSNFLPELLVIIWDVQRIGVWPMGNLGPNGWEGPVYDPSNHTLLRWEAGAVQDRKFPVDNGAFAFASELLGSTIMGPRYWPTDISGGENEFISLIVDKKEDIEPLCYNCHLAWHNEPLPPACTDLQICP
ncbi:Beta-1,3-glucuronyltransferase 2 (Glucuronosyltransferase S) [Puccinia graminis f. sp. tritici]|uniref:Beta-1,3-glucuronyltransferase 2 (Glucuronosyltransferase S) n=1 Tax=Puccinia graminis f. sp. tritici TaxID=56615 RepID=A0A5B0S8G9_PUCGR|nr:Beta-1,3-glucuronyltransferase 2 (Glucuronosyltransferase S) [Puccinia graminis f. sp. tritici]